VRMSCPEDGQADGQEGGTFAEAVFVTEIPRRAIAAGTSERGCCPTETLEREVTLATGAADDVYLCHPFALQAA